MITRTRWGKQVQPISITSHSHASVLTNLLRAVEKATGGHGGFVYEVRLPVQWYIAVLYFPVLDQIRPKTLVGQLTRLVVLRACLEEVGHSTYTW